MDNDNVNKGNSSWVKLNVGGRVFQTSKQTLQSRPGTLLARICAEDSQLQSAKDESGAILIDRNPDYFSVVLDFLRHGKLVFPTNCSIDGIREEADFFNLAELVTLCQIHLDEIDSNRKKQELLCQKQLDETASANRKKALQFLTDNMTDLNIGQKQALKLAELGLVKNIQLKVRGYPNLGYCCLLNLTITLDNGSILTVYSGKGYAYYMTVDLFVNALIRGGFRTIHFSNKKHKPTYVMEI